MLFGFKDPAAPDLAVSDEASIAAEPTDDPPGGNPPQARSPWGYLLAGLTIGALAIALAWAAWPEQEQGLTEADLEVAIADELDARTQGPTVATQAYERVAPSLVAVRANSAVESDPTNIGAGVVINEQGNILTSLHVVVDAESIELLFADGTRTAAELTSTDETLDIAVLSTIDRGAVLVPAVMGNSRTLQVGDTVFAVGSPLGLTASMTAGVISGLNREIPLDDGVTLKELIQFDAAVNQGSSGGPLINTDGQVVGIVTALADPGGQGFFVGIGFAVPIDIAASRAADGPSQ